MGGRNFEWVRNTLNLQLIGAKDLLLFPQGTSITNLLYLKLAFPDSSAPPLLTLNSISMSNSSAAGGTTQMALAWSTYNPSTSTCPKVQVISSSGWNVGPVITTDSPPRRLPIVILRYTGKEPAPLRESFPHIVMHTYYHCLCHTTITQILEALSMKLLQKTWKWAFSNLGIPLQHPQSDSSR